MNRPRVIPVLLIQGESLVKTVKFGSPRYVGDPLNAVRIFNEKMVDELVILDIDASKVGRSPNMVLIKALAEECFMPLCYGGGVTTVEQMQEIFFLGVEKIAINTGILDNLELLRQASTRFGSQSVVASIDVKVGWTGCKVFSHSGRKAAHGSPESYARAVQDAGAGEIFLNNVDADGARMGFNLDLCRAIAAAVDIPVVACGGGGEFEHFRDVIEQAGVAGAAGGSFFVFQGRYKAVLISYPAPEEIEGIGQHGDSKGKQ